MKLLNFFKKGTSKAVKSNVQKIDKIQLEKVIGGTDLIKCDCIKVNASQNQQTL